jgi:hypothetical protein
MEGTVKIKLNIYLDGYDCGDIMVEVPQSLYDGVDWRSLRRKDDFRQSVKLEYPQLSDCIDKAVDDAMNDGTLVDLDAVADMCGQTFIGHSGAVTFGYRDVDDYISRVKRKYILIE